MTEDQQDSRKSRLVFEIVIPDHITDVQITEYIAELVLAADLKHRELGGHGLKINSITAVKGQP